ncbi:hypothetical protein PIB30_066303 [Stylosanthes scabra]|uniref:Uncharacterized protein n=1 Tax=Stylosanthes scabra TaxID=79078 RepID=A0ABU6TN72_9FABA|nr:hypothetical protein [Stylosanthes scabra]
MVYYVDVPFDKGWCSVCHMKPRDLYDTEEFNQKDLSEFLVQDISFCEQQVENIQEFPLVREEDNEPEVHEMHARSQDISYLGALIISRALQARISQYSYLGLAEPGIA